MSHYQLLKIIAMAKKEDKKDKLLKFLDENVFDPILESSDEDYSEEERGNLESVKEFAAKEKDKYHKLVSSEEVVNQFHSDLTSEEGINEKLDSLNLPKLADVESEFDDLLEDTE